MRKILKNGVESLVYRRRMWEKITILSRKLNQANKWRNKELKRLRKFSEEEKCEKEGRDEES